MDRKSLRCIHADATRLRLSRMAVACSAAFLLPAALTSPPSPAADLYWSSAATGTRWLDAINWIGLPPGGGFPLPGSVPTGNDNVEIASGTVLIDGAATAGTLNFRAAAGRLTIDSLGGLTLLGDSRIRGRLDLFGSLKVAAGTKLTAEWPLLSVFPGAALVNDGTVRLAPGAEITFLADATGSGRYVGAPGSLLDIAGGRLTAQSALQVTRLRLAPDPQFFTSVGSIGGSGPVDVQTFEWGHGIIGTAATPGTRVGVDGTATIGHFPIFDDLSRRGATPLLGYGSQLEVRGTATWAYGGVPITIDGPATLASGQQSAPSRLIVAAGATFEDLGQPTDQGFRRISGGGIFELAGTYRKTGPGHTFIDAAFANRGSLAVNAGTLLLAGDTLHDQAQVSIGADGTLRQFGGTFAAGTVIDHRGTLVLDYNARIGQGVTYIAAPTSLLQVAGHAVRIDSDIHAGAVRVDHTLGGSGTVTAASLDWRAGNLGEESGPAGATIVTGHTDLSTSILTLQQGRTLRLEGTTTWARGQSLFSGLGTINLRRDAVMTVAAGAVFDDLGEAVNAGGRRLFSPDFNAWGRFVNDGTYRRTGLGSTILQVDVTNRGLIDVQSGELYSAFGLANHGELRVAPEAQLTLAGLTTLASGTTLANQGTLMIRGQTRIDTDASIGGRVVLSLGTVHGSGDVRLANLEWEGGRFGDPNVPGSSTGSVTVTGAAHLVGADHGVYDGYRLVLDGATRFIPSGRLLLGENATVTIGRNGVFTDEGIGFTDRTIAGSAGSRFVNDGTYVKSSGTGTTQFSTRFDNTGQVSVNAGRLQLNSGGTFGQGRLDVAAGATAALWFVNVQPGVTVNNDGTMELIQSRFVAGSTFSSGPAGRVDLLVGQSTIDTDMTTAELRLRTDPFNGSSGLLVGTGTVTTNRLVWEAGAWMGEPANPGGRTIVNGLATFTGLASPSGTNAFRLEGQRVLELNGTTIWEAGTPSIHVGMFNPVAPGPILRIGRDGVFEDRGGFNPLLVREIVGAGTLENEGTFRRDGFANDFTRIRARFVNRGLLEVRKGELLLAGRFDNAPSGRVDAAPGAFLRIENAAGWDPTTRTFSGGELVVRAGATVEVEMQPAIGTSGGAQAIRRNEAAITLIGSGAELTSLYSFVGVRSALDALEENAGVLILLDGASIVSSTALVNTGRIAIGEGSELAIAGVLTQVGSGAALDVRGRLRSSGLSISAGTLGTGAERTIGTARFGAMPASFGAGATLALDVDPFADVADLFEFDGAVTLGGTLNVAFRLPPGGSGRYRVLSATGGVTGRFDAIMATGLDLGLYAVGVETAGNDVFLTLAPVPEPHQWALMVAGFGIVATLAGRRRRRPSRSEAACTCAASRPGASTSLREACP